MLVAVHNSFNQKGSEPKTDIVALCHCNRIQILCDINSLGGIGQTCCVGVAESIHCCLFATIGHLDVPSVVLCSCTGWEWRLLPRCSERTTAFRETLVSSAQANGPLIEKHKCTLQTLFVCLYWCVDDPFRVLLTFCGVDSLHPTTWMN